MCTCTIMETYFNACIVPIKVLSDNGLQAILLRNTDASIVSECEKSGYVNYKFCTQISKPLVPNHRCEQGLKNCGQAGYICSQQNSSRLVL